MLFLILPCLDQSDEQLDRIWLDYTIHYPSLLQLLCRFLIPFLV